MNDDDRRTNDRLAEVLNGEWDDMDAVTRRAFVVIGNEMDGIHRGVRDLSVTLNTFTKAQTERDRKARGQLVGIYTALITTIGTVTVAAIAAFG